MNLEDLGWTPSWSEALAADFPSSQPGRIVRLDNSCATAQTASGERRIDLPGRLRRGEHSLVVGDWIAIELQGEGEGRAVGLLPRRTHVARKAAGRQVRRQLLAANVDLVFIVSSMDDDLSERRIERYLTVVHDGGARPVLLLTKAGLVDDPSLFVQRARRVAPGVDVHGIDVVAGLGTERPASYLARGRTAVLVGSSGVGKSTLLNHLVGDVRMATGDVAARDGLGQHTTTHRELFVLPHGGVVIDTPGLRELALWAEASALNQAFAEVEALARGCRFHDCSHGREPGCAVNEAVAAGSLEASRLRGFLDLRQEIERTAAQIPVHEQRRKERQQGRLYREIQTHKRRRR